VGQGSRSSSERLPACQDLLASSAHCSQKTGVIFLHYCRGSTGLASVREKRRSRHACQALLLWFYVAIRTVRIPASVYSRPALHLPSFFSPLWPYSDLRLRELPASRERPFQLPAHRGQVHKMSKGCRWSRRSALLATGQRRHPPEQVR
jgi:hypothetical protein